MLEHKTDLILQVVFHASYSFECAVDFFENAVQYGKLQGFLSLKGIEYQQMWNLLDSVRDLGCFGGKCFLLIFLEKVPCRRLRTGGHPVPLFAGSGSSGRLLSEPSGASTEAATQWRLDSSLPGRVL